MPFLGSYDLRDGVGSVADEYMRPRHYINNLWVNYGLWLTNRIDLRARFLPTNRIVDSSYDPYAFIRNAYLQNRDFMVNGAQSQSEEQREQQMLEEAGESEEPPPSAPAPGGAALPSAPTPANAPTPAAPPPPRPER